MKRSAPMFTLSLLLCASLSVARAADAGQDKDRVTITADYILDDTAAESKDANASVADLTDDFTDIDEKGEIDAHSRAEELQNAKQLFSVADKITSHTVITAIDFTAEGATVTSTLDLTVNATVKGETHTLSDKSTSRDVWVKSGDVWLEKSSTTTVARHFIDGNPVK